MKNASTRLLSIKFIVHDTINIRKRELQDIYCHWSLKTGLPLTTSTASVFFLCVALSALTWPLDLYRLDDLGRVSTSLTSAYGPPSEKFVLLGSMDSRQLSPAACILPDTLTSLRGTASDRENTFLVPLFLGATLLEGLGSTLICSSIAVNQTNKIVNKKLKYHLKWKLFCIKQKICCPVS